MKVMAAAAGLVFAIVAAAADAPHFEAASVKRSTQEGRRSMATSPGGLSYVNVTLSDCLRAAYHLERHQVAGPSWLAEERYVVTARTATATDGARLMQMLQSLLIERFRVELHREMRQLLAYVLRQGKDLRGLKPVDTRDGVVPAPGGMTFQGLTMSEFTDVFLAGLPFLDRPVINETGLSGRFSFTLKMVDDDSGTADLKRAAMNAGPDLIIHALEAVGLRLERAKVQAEVLVVDRAERVPVEN
jgi:uncharacterized protein (TIGR03435 family)